MANVEVVPSGEFTHANRVVVRDSNDRVYVFVETNGNIRAMKGNVTGEPTSFAEQEAGGAPDNSDNDGIAAAIDANGLVHVIYNFEDPAAHGAAPKVRYAQFRTSAHATTQDDWVLIDEDVADLDNSADNFIFSELLAIAIDANNVPHVAWNEEQSNMGSDVETISYANRIGGSWNTKVQVQQKTSGSSSNFICDIIIADPHSGINADRPIIITNRDNSVAEIDAFHGTALNATAFTVASDITGTINKVSSASLAIDSNEKLVVAFIETTTLDLMVVEHLNSQTDWSIWETPLDVDTSTNYVNPSIAIDGTNRYIFVEDSSNNDINLWKNTDPTNTYHFDGSDTAAEDADGVWTNETNADDGDKDTDATTNTSGSNGSNDLFIGGTNAPSSGDTIQKVKARVFGDAEASGDSISVDIHTDGQGESLGQLTLDSSEGWSRTIILSVPSGGWTFAKLQALEATAFKTGTTLAGAISRVEIIVETGSGWVEETTDADLPNVGTFDDIKVKWASKNNNSPAKLDYVFSSTLLSYNTFDAAAGATVVTETHDTDSVLKALDNEETHTTDSILKALDNEITHTTDSFLLAKQTEDHTTDSVLKALDQTLDHDTDSVLKALDNELTHTTDSVLVFVQTEEHTTDSVLKALDQTEEHTTDSFLLAVRIEEHTTDSVLRAIDNEISHTTDSFLLAVRTEEHTTDSILKALDQEETHTTDSILKELDNEITHTTDSHLFAERTEDHTTDSVLKALDQEVTHTTDSALREIDNELTHTTDSVLVSVQLITHDTNSVLKALDQEITHTTDSFLKAIQTEDHTTDSVLKLLDNEITHTTDSILGEREPGFTIEHTTDSILKALDQEITHTTDSVLAFVVTLEHTTDSFLLAVRTLTHDTDSVLKALDNEITHTTDSFLAQVVLVTHDTDSVLKALDQLVTHDTDSVLKKLDNEITHTTDSVLGEREPGISVTHTTDSVLKELDNEITHDTDSVLRELDNEITHTTDSHLFAERTLTHTTDSVLGEREPGISITHTTNSVLKELDNLVTHTTDSFLVAGVVAITVTHTTDSLVVIGVELSHTTDSILRKLDNEITHTTDSIVRLPPIRQVEVELCR